MQTCLASKDLGSEIELGWQSEVGKLYTIQESDDLRAWTPFGGALEGDGAYFTIRLPKTAPNRFYKLKVGIVDGTRMPTMAVCAFNGSYVDVLWQCPGELANGSPRYEVHRNGALLATRPFGQETYRDTAILSGGRYHYDVKFFA